MLVIPISSQLYKLCQAWAAEQRMVFMTGLPGVGKSLLIQQLALIAGEAGRQVHLLQYNLAREPFETQANIQRYPEIEGVTDPAIRKGVGLWAREAVWRWHEAHPEPEHLLIGELPLIGSRLIELVEVHDDPAEPLLSSDAALFVIPVPSWEVREVIEETRARTIADPRHEKEKLDAPPNVLRALWQEVNGLARQIGLTKAGPQTPYNPYIYGGVYEALLQHRRSRPLLIDQVLRPARSVYDMEIVSSVLRATPAEVDHFMQEVERRCTPAALREAVGNWHAIVTADPPTPDPGPELRLPLPEDLPAAVAQTELTVEQRAAVRAVLDLPLDAEPERVIAVLDRAFAALEPAGGADPAAAGVHKFDVYDSYFNVTRTAGEKNGGLVFLAGLFQSYRNVLANLATPPETLTVVELPLLRIALENSVRVFLEQGAGVGDWR